MESIIYKVIIFVTFCVPTPEGTKCLNRDAVVNSTPVADKAICDSVAEQANFIFLENDVRYINVGDNTFFLPGAKCEVTQ